MSSLHQIVALVNGQRARTDKTITNIYHGIQKPDRYIGLSRTYQPRDDEGEPLPPESKIVECKVQDDLRAAKAAFSRLWNLISMQDISNCSARADVVIDGNLLAIDVPTSTLLFLEKQLEDLIALVRKLPVLSTDEEWFKDEQTGHYKTAATETIRNKKIPRNHVVAEATDKHPAQVHVYNEDVPVGTWSLVKRSGAIPSRQRDEIISRVERAIDAVHAARELANQFEVKSEGIGSLILDYILD